MVKSKNKIRITAMLIILAFVLIPLLSSNVSATITWRAGNGWTTNTPTGPTGAVTMSAPGSITDPTPPPPPPNNAQVIFTFGYTFTDSHGGPAGSRHRVDMTCTPGGWSTTTWVNVAPGASTSGVHSSPIYSNLKGTSYSISVTIICQDLNVPPFSQFSQTRATTCVVN